MDPNTLTLYTVAAGLSASLSVVLMVYARFQPGTLLIKHSAMAILVLAAGFFVSGIGPMLPRGATVIGTNLVLLSAGVILHAGFYAYCNQRSAAIDWFGWAVVALAAPAFWYWGLVEPDGGNRSAVFSFSCAVINGRTAYALAGNARKGQGGLPAWAMAIVFGTLTVWMLARGGLHLFVETSPPDARGANPTSWLTVFWYIVLVSIMAVCVLWMESNRLKGVDEDDVGHRWQISRFIEYFRNKLLLLWSAVIILIFGIVSELSITYNAVYSAEKASLVRRAESANEVFVGHAVQMANQVDTLLHSVRAYYLRTRSIPATQEFIATLGFDRFVIDNIYLIDAEGKVVISHDPATRGRSVADREYFPFHRNQSDDQLHISPVESGRITGMLHFRMTRRISNHDGSFGGIVLATVNPESITRYYRQVGDSADSLATLLATTDRKMRARIPLPPPDRWSDPIESPLWELLQTANYGQYENTSPVDAIPRIFAYRKLGHLPLVMVTGFATEDVAKVTRERMRGAVLTSITLLLVTMLLAVLLTIEARRRDEQQRFMSMLSHELKTPMSVVRMAVGVGGMPPEIATRVSRAITDMTAVIERCLLSDKLQYGHIAATPIRCQVADLLADIREGSSAPERVEVCGHQLPLCATDVQLLRVILANLVDNALKYGAPGTMVTVSAEPEAQRGRPGIRIDVTNLPGSASPPDPHRVFEKYYRGPGSRGKTGSGLGLHIAAEMAKKLGARLRYLPGANEIKFELWIPV